VRTISTAATSAELTRYAIGSMIPDQVVHPADEREAAQTLLAARNAGETVVPVGGATLLDVGDAPSSYALAVATDRISGIVEYNPGDLTIVVRAGTTLGEVEAELREHRQFLSVQAPFPARATIGGTLAANVSGPLRLAYGSVRDAVIGTRVALPSGHVAKSGGRVVKNVAGYDLSKLFIGSFGTLGVIVEAAFKVFPLPVTRRVLVAPAAGVSAALDFAATVARLGPGLLSLAVVNDPLARAMKLERSSTIVLVGGTAEATEELIAEICSRASSPKVQTLREPESTEIMGALQDFPGRATVRMSARMSRPFASTAESAEIEALSYPTIGTSFLCAPNWNGDDVAAMRRDAARSGGNVVVWRRSPGLEGVSTWGELGPELALMRAVKSVFDPQRIMSPGRFVGDI
jgi:glycolate oxidase FAD binding subunit